MVQLLSWYMSCLPERVPRAVAKRRQLFFGRVVIDADHDLYD